MHKSWERFAAQASSESVRGLETSENVSPERWRLILETIRCTGVERERQRPRDIEKRKPRASGADTLENVSPERLVALPRRPQNKWIPRRPREDVQGFIDIFVFACVL